MGLGNILSSTLYIKKKTKSQWKNINIIKELWVLDEPCTNKPFMVGLDMAKIAGFVETDSLIALSTWVEPQPLKLRNSIAEKFILPKLSKMSIAFIYLLNIIHWGMWHDRIYIEGNYLLIENTTNARQTKEHMWPNLLNLKNNRFKN